MSRRNAQAAAALRAALDAGDEKAEKIARQLPRAEVRRLRQRGQRRERIAAGEEPRPHLGWGT